MSSTDPKEEKPRDHEFDGIREYDNDMPKWWVNLFIITIIFSVLYLAWYHLPFFPSKSLLDEYESAYKIAAEANLEKKVLAAKSSFDYGAAIKDQAVLARGKETFTSTCSPCHAVDGGGGVGPNLTDNFWIHGGSPEKIEEIILKGAPEKGMPSWEPVLGIDKIRETATYVVTLRGTKPAVAKEPQGTEE